MSNIQISTADFREALRQARAAAWDQCVASMTYEDGSPVDVALNSNPFKDEK